MSTKPPACRWLAHGLQAAPSHLSPAQHPTPRGQQELWGAQSWPPAPGHAAACAVPHRAVPGRAVRYSLRRTQGVMEMKDMMPQRLPLRASSTLLRWQAAGWV